MLTMTQIDRLAHSTCNLFAVVKGIDGNIYLNQGQLDGPFTGWQAMT